MSQQKKRFVYIDLLRGWAVLVMVEVHVVNAFLLPEIRDQAWFTILNFINGIVAPAFLFISGYAFTLVGQRKWNDYLAGNKVLWKQVARIAQVWVIGYALHIPKFSLKALSQLNAQGWELFWKVDVLHTIALSLSVLLLLVIVMRTQKNYFMAVLLLTAGVIFVSPLMYNRNVDSSLPLALANYCSAAHGSQFPIFPWMAFVLFGGITAQLSVWWKDTVKESTMFTWFFVAGVGAIAMGIISIVIPGSFYSENNYWQANPAFFFIRLGIVLALLASLWYWEVKRHSGASAVSVVGSESLVAYAGHLLVIYGMFFNNRSLSFIIGKTRNVTEVLLMTTVLVVLTAAASYCWHRIKNWSMFYARVMQYSILIVVIYFFCSNQF